MADITTDTIVVAAADQVSCDLDGETAILHLGTDVYYGLDEIGARVWALLQEPSSVRRLCEVLAAEYEVTSQQCEADTLALVRELAAEGLVDVRP